MVKLLLIITSVFFTACVSRAPQKTITKKKTRMTRFGKLDTADANRKLLEYRWKLEQELPGIEFEGNVMYCEYIDTMGYEVYLAKYDDGYLKRRQVNGALFGELRYYFLNGNLQQSGEYYNRDFECGIWKEYDIEGHLLKEVNKDEPYKQFSWQKVLLFTKKKDIDLNDERTYVGRYIDESNIPCWDISWHKKGEGFGRNVVIDARNGRIVDEVISRMEK